MVFEMLQKYLTNFIRHFFSQIFQSDLFHRHL